ncbi:Extracellular metalloproteinase mep [Mycena indigotica]|uniref:Extracellular metalloproteinase n=1 Tax=Mycena indigotica TaxID=2126181 RepID=A0A8H6W4R1_9AGAR|nr:Extracellular metalloproteinase mep [Mycena indigotica]KAF7301728.1 Extracellular metalloproteinase mep [Mycena indigotica]
MVAFTKFFNTVLLAVLYASSSSALTVPTNSKHATHRVREIANGAKIETYHPESTYETFNTGIDHPLRKRGASLKEASESFISSHLKVAPSSVLHHSGFAGEVATHSYAKQVINGIPVANAVANVAFNSDDLVVALGSSFVKPTKVAATTPSVSLEDAKTTAESALDAAFLDEVEPTIEYFIKEDHSAVLVHVFQVRNEEKGLWYNAFVDAQTNTLVSVTDYVAKATYRVLPIQKETLLEGFEDVADPQDTVASPNGWHSDGTTNSTTTSGNNAISYKSSQSTGTAAETSAGVYSYIQNPAQAPTVTANVKAAIVNNFYLVNSIHDITYRYGFTEAAFNFQNNNFGKGGKGNDRVTSSIQDSAGSNNADFSTPPDGQSGHMRMYIFTSTSPNRDGALENDVPVHENTHGVTNRMTGGGTGACLQSTEAGGMGEGWSDAMADWTEKNSSAVPDYVMGQYIINSAAGIRTHPYSTSKTVNPLTYASVGTLNEVHNIGEVWANLLHNVYAALVGAHGWAADAKTNPDGTAGNVVYLHLFLDALALQPCNPTFLTARNAWLQADVNRYSGANRCLLWKAFASRGLGVNAANHKDNADIPSDC